MCPPQTIPSNTRIERLQAMLEAAEATSEAQDIFALDQRVIGSNDELVDGTNHIISTLDPDRVQETLLNQGRIRIPYTLPSDYEDIFTLPGLSRRSARPINNNDPNPITIEEVLLIEDWANMCLDDTSKKVDEYLPGDMTAFEQLMDHGMPARLGLDTWIGRTVLAIVAERFPLDDNDSEAALIALARRVARYIACCIVFRYTTPMYEVRGNDVLNTAQVARAVREILGEEWFDLPFDVDGALRNWSESDVWTADE